MAHIQSNLGWWNVSFENFYREEQKKKLITIIHYNSRTQEFKLTRAINVPLTASITPGENINVTPGSTVNVARAPIMRWSCMMHGLLNESIVSE